MLAGGFDTNLDFDFADPNWAAFARSARCSVTSSTDLDLLTTAVRQQLFDFAYIPSANCYFVQGAPFRGLVSALTARSRKPAQSSVFVVAKSNPAKSWEDLRGKRYGYINTYCTTSYFSPSILLGRAGYKFTDFFVTFPVAAWQGQIDAVLAGTIDSTMVFEDVWLAKPENAERTKILARLDDLPTPAFIAKSDLAADVTANLKKTLLGMPPATGPDALYAGFTDYQDARMERFFADLAALPGLARAA
jgi:phosphonate transport system substrate-binding protein